MSNRNWHAAVSALTARIHSDWNLYAVMGIIAAIIALGALGHRHKCYQYPENCNNLPLSPAAGQTFAAANTSAIATDDLDDKNLEYEHRGAVAAEIQAASAVLTLILGIIGTIFVVQALMYNRESTHATILAAKSSSEAATAAAKSTEIAEKALYILERAYIYPSDIQFEPGNLEKIINIRVKNMGRSPAILESIVASYTITPQNVYGNTPLYSGRRPFMASDTIGAGDFSDWFFFSDHGIARFRESILSGVNAMHLTISIEWSDILESKRFVSLAFIWHYRMNRFVHGVQVWDEIDPSTVVRRP